MLEAFGDLGDPKDLQQELHYKVGRDYLTKSVKSNIVAIHAAIAGWKNRTLPRHVWRAVFDGVKRMGLRPALVGTDRDNLYAGDTAEIPLGWPLAVQAAFISECAAFIGSDSAMLHLAGCTDVPIIGVFTCARPETRLPWRHGQLGWRCEAVMPDLECVGCQARRPPPVTDEFCERGDTRCIELVSAANILAALQKVIAL